MKATAYIREDIRWAHSLLEMVVQDVTPEQADWHPPGLANPIGATYAHAVCGEDVIIRQMLQNDEPLLESSWKGRTGISEPQLSADFEWARRCRWTCRRPASTLRRCTPPRTSTWRRWRTRPSTRFWISAQGFEHKPVAWVLQRLVISHPTT
jgi:hypothetical protein